ncbi:MAG TPA: GntR family transcriptional regulator [Pseudonocardiaceae bacterium]|nr:GntR family transcriptional regulator [Pseudonocardiaceae bacterium]
MSTQTVQDRSPLDRPSIAERVADVLRVRITEGYYRPGSRLSEEAIGGELQISRNTLREAFRLLTHERLLLHEPYRGVSVRVLTADDVSDLYRVRKVVECGIVADPPDLTGLHRVELAVREGERAFDDADWQALGTANIHFHQALVALAGSARLDDLMRGILAELRLVFHVMADPRRFHEPYLTRNREIAGLLVQAEFAAATTALRRYLDDAEQQLVQAYSAG